MQYEVISDDGGTVGTYATLAAARRAAKADVAGPRGASEVIYPPWRDPGVIEGYADRDGDEDAPLSGIRPRDQSDD